MDSDQSSEHDDNALSPVEDPLPDKVLNTFTEFTKQDLSPIDRRAMNKSVGGIPKLDLTKAKKI